MCCPDRYLRTKRHPRYRIIMYSAQTHACAHMNPKPAASRGILSGWHAQTHVQAHAQTRNLVRLRTASGSSQRNDDGPARETPQLPRMGDTSVALLRSGVRAWTRDRGRDGLPAFTGVPSCSISPGSACDATPQSPYYYDMGETPLVPYLRTSQNA